jgi:hypothetical protein
VTRSRWTILAALLACGNGAVIGVNACGEGPAWEGPLPEAHATPPSTRLGRGRVSARPGGPTTAVVRPAVAAQAAGFDFDLSAASLPAGITPVRSSSSTVYLQTGAATVTSVSGTGADIAEDRGDGMGRLRWSLRTMTNDLGTSHSDFAATGYSLQGGLTRTASAATGPDGVASSATKLSDTSSGATGYLQYLGTVDGAGAVNINAVWAKDDPADAPTLDPSAALISYVGHSGTVSQVSADVPNGLGWKRVGGQWPSSNQFAYSILFGADAPTTQPSTTWTTNASATGSILVWGASSYHAVAGDAYDAPLAAGALGNLSWQFGAGAVAQLYSGSDLHLEIELVSDPFFVQDGGVGEVWTIFSAATPSGAHKVRWTHSGQGVLYTVNGAEINGSALIAPVGSVIKLEPWNIGGVAGTRGIHVWLNGARGLTGVNTGLALTSPTDAWLGSDLGVSGFTPIRNKCIRKSSRGIDLAEGVILGDSLLSAYPGAHAMMGTRIYTAAEADDRDGIISYATAGETALQQYGRWQNAPQRGQATTKWVAILVGINDIGGVPNQTGATVISRINTLTADIKSSTPGATVIIASLLPTASTLTADHKTAFDLVNTAISGGGGTPITNVDHRIGLWTTMAHNSVGDSTSNLIGSCDPLSDGRHQGDACGTDVIAAALRAKLVLAGLL